MVVTKNGDLYERVEYLRRHGGKVKYHHEELGLNSRLDELQAAILRVKLKHLDVWNARRRQIAAVYNRLLADVPQVTTPVELDHGGLFQSVEASTEENALLTTVYHQYTILVEHRDELSRDLRAAGIGCSVYYPVPLHLQAVHAPLGYRRGDFPCAENAAGRCLSVPMFPELTFEQQQRVVEGLREATGRQRRSASILSCP
jgi:dTDP-4-amino-4,6-dideoxygalactose transaminase